MSEPEKVEASSQPVVTGVKPQQYKCLLIQLAQKICKQLPLYETHNEGSGHQPKFRCTVWVDGVSYTSPNTFQQRKLAEKDASMIAYFATLDKLKNEASCLVREDKSFCKSILVEYAVRMNIQRPTYHTIQLETQIPVFRSSLVFDDVSCTGDDSRSKKEAEQSAARAIILKLLDSESGNIMSEIIKCKFRNYDEMKDIQSAYNGTNEVVQTGFENSLTLNEAKVEEVTKIPDTSAVQEDTTTIPATHLSVDVTQKHTQEVSTQALTPPIHVPTVLEQTPFGGTHNIPTDSIISAPSMEHYASIPATHTSNVIQPANSEASSLTVAPPLPLSSTPLAQETFVGPSSSKKRNDDNHKKDQKKMRVEDQLPIPAIPLSIVPPFSSQ